MILNPDAIKNAAAAGLALAALVAVVYVWRRGFAGAAKDTSKAAVNVLGGAIAGTVEGVGEAVGIPATDDDQCTKDLAAGDTLAASFSCPASRFIKSVFSNKQ